MSFSGSAPEEKKPAAPEPVAAPVVPAGDDEEIIAVLCAAVAACDVDEILPIVGRLGGNASWTNYARVAAVTARDPMF